jgi:hypothetical protein
MKKANANRDVRRGPTRRGIGIWTPSPESIRGYFRVFPPGRMALLLQSEQEMEPQPRTIFHEIDLFGMDLTILQTPAT